MNKLPLHKRVMILQMLVEGSALRSISRTVGVSINTVTKLLVDAGNACAEYHESTVRNVYARRVECDEIWSFCYAKQKTVKKLSSIENGPSFPEGAGDVWTWTAIDADSRMIIAYEIGDRSVETAYGFMRNLRSRVANCIQLNTDGHKSDYTAVKAAFGHDLDYAQLVKIYGDAEEGKTCVKKYSSPKCTDIVKKPIFGNQDMDEVSTSYVERQNLAMRMGMRRYTRLTNAHSKKLQNHLHSLSLHFVHHNFVKVVQTLKVTPAMATGLADKPCDVEWIIGLIDAREEKPNRPTTYKKRISN